MVAYVEHLGSLPVRLLHCMTKEKAEASKRRGGSGKVRTHYVNYLDRANES